MWCTRPVRTWMLLFVFFYTLLLLNIVPSTRAFCCILQKSVPQSTAARCVSSRHLVDGIECVQVPIHVDRVGVVTVLEATAESQEVLVDMALEEPGKQEENNTCLKLHSGDPYGAVLWPAASAIANCLVNLGVGSNNNKNHHHNPLKGMSVLELGAGTGLVSITASLAGADRVIATDYEEVPLQLLEYAARCLNRQGTPIETAHLDMCDFDTFLPMADVVVAADVMYEPITGRSVARRAVQALQRGSRVLVGDSPGRAGRPAFLQELKRLGVSAAFVDTVGTTCCGPRHELICGQGSTSVSETPQELAVAIMDLDPTTCFVNGNVKPTNNMG